MNHRNPNHLVTLVALAEAAALPAARWPRLPASTVSEHVPGPGRNPHCELAIRTTRRNRLTEAGRLLAAVAARVERRTGTLRVGPPEDSSLIRRNLGTVRQDLVATVASLAAHGRPEGPVARAGHCTVGIRPAQTRQVPGPAGPRAVTLVAQVAMTDPGAVLSDDLRRGGDRRRAPGSGATGAGGCKPACRPVRPV